jgi:hypothetical protein
MGGKGCGSSLMCGFYQVPHIVDCPVDDVRSDAGCVDRTDLRSMSDESSRALVSRICDTPDRTHDCSDSSDGDNP